MIEPDTVMIMMSADRASAALGIELHQYGEVVAEFRGRSHQLAVPS